MKHDQTHAMKYDQMSTVKHDQIPTVKHGQIYCEFTIKPTLKHDQSYTETARGRLMVKHNHTFSIKRNYYCCSFITAVL